MAHYAKVLNGNVVNVIVAEPSFFDNFVDASPGTWIKTSYNTQGGVHANGGTPLRGNFAGIGYSYDHVLDVFIPPKPAEGQWVLNDKTFTWDAVE